MMRKFPAVVVAVTLAALMIGTMPVEIEAAADLYRHASSCDGTPSYGGNTGVGCHAVIVFGFALLGGGACTAFNIGAGFFTMGYTWIIGHVYCGLAGAY